MAPKTHTNTREFRLRRGLDVRVAGTSAGAVPADGPLPVPVRRVALLGADYPGLRPDVLVAVGDRVTLGQPLVRDRHDPAVRFTAPGTGTVTAIAFGERRALHSVVVQLEDDAPQRSLAPALDPATAPPGLIRERLQEAGLWTAFRTRPFERIPGSGDPPAALFVTAIDTAPLAADPRTALGRNPGAFAAGIMALTRLTAGNVYVCRAPGAPLPLPDVPQVVDAVFSGPHPAGLPGTHIHHLCPAGARRTVWHVGAQDVLAIGQLLTTGTLDLTRVVALGGAVAPARLLATRQGASLAELVPAADPGLRVLSGDALAGREAHGADAWLGRYDRQVTVLREPGAPRPLRWLVAALTAVGPRRHHGAGTTRMYGRPSGMLPIDAFERVLPFDLLPSPLLRALLLRDTEAAVSLGCLELAEEDLALCSYVCPARQDYGAALRATLDDYRRNG